MPCSFKARVADEAIEKVSRLFNATLDDIVNELFQNARRAGARTVAVDEIDDPEFGPAIRVSDDGPGLDDPRTLFTLAKSGWDANTRHGEDAAGMGFFSLANRGVRAIVQRSGSRRPVTLRASAAAFAGRELIAACAGPSGHRGVTVIFPRLAAESVEATAQSAALYCPLEIVVNGSTAQSKDFLEEAVHVEEWNGVRIGVFPQCRFRAADRANVNFHGVTLRAPLPSLPQLFHRGYQARIDVVHCAALQMVLPARKEVVRNAFFDELCAACTAVLFRKVANDGAHSLSHADYSRGRELGVDLAEAAMLLRPFAPRRANPHENFAPPPEPVTADAVLYDGAGDAIGEQNLARALGRRPDGLRLHEPAPAFNGYAWYDGLGCIAVAGYRLDAGGRTEEIAPGGRFAFDDRPDRLQVLLERGDRDGSVRSWPLETDLVLGGDEDAGPGDAGIYVTASSKLTPAGLVDVLQAALFCPGDDCDAGSYDEQHRRFCDEAEDCAFFVLRSRDEARVNAVIRTIRRELAWRLPRDRPVTITLRDGEIEVTGLTA